MFDSAKKGLDVRDPLDVPRPSARIDSRIVAQRTREHGAGEHRHLPSNTAAADNTQGQRSRAVQDTTRGVVPVASTDGPVHRGQTAQQRQNHRKRMSGDLQAVAIRHVGDPHPFAPGGIECNVVGPDEWHGDDPKPRQSLDHLGSDGRKPRYQAAGPGSRRSHLAGGSAAGLHNTPAQWHIAHVFGHTATDRLGQIGEYQIHRFPAHVTIPGTEAVFMDPTTGSPAGLYAAAGGPACS